MIADAPHPPVPEWIAAAINAGPGHCLRAGRAISGSATCLRFGAQQWSYDELDGLVDEAAAAEADAGHPFLRYWVGEPPPDGEQRHSAPDVDSGLNAVGMYGGLSFIIEAAAFESGAPAGDLGNRVDAYLVLYRRFLSGGSRRAHAPAARTARRATPEPTSRYDEAAAAPCASARPRATSAPKKTRTDWAARTVAHIRQVNVPNTPYAVSPVTHALLWPSAGQPRARCAGRTRWRPGTAWSQG